ncbi:MAG: U32 family peptidase, partial [Candidatus Pacearchaeota archaeon]
NSKTAEFYKKLGAKRIVLARELNLKQIKKISKIIPIEVFIHGAMCVSESGRCFTSQFLFNQSANRGKCIHPCRRAYQIKDEEGNELKLENNFVMSAKDLCTLPFIEKLKKAGIVSFKIEGRNKEPEYIDAVVRVYRKALDKKLTKEQIKEGLNELNKVYNKGFSSGFYLKLPTSDDFSNLENSSASQSKKFIGKIHHYYDKINVGLLKLNNGPLKLSDEILIIGKTTGILKSKVESMQMKHKEITQAEKGQEIGIKLPFCRKGDELYLIVKRKLL